MSQNGPESEPPAQAAPPPRERAFNAPWPPLLLAALIIGLYAWQSRTLDQEALYFRFGLVPAQAGQGRWTALVTSLFVHGGWAHAITNAVGTLAFGAGVARLFGTRPAGAAAFFLFFLVCGVLAGWGYVLLKPDLQLPMVGASGGIAGLFGAASRVIRSRGRRLTPITHPTVLGVAAAWVVVNLIFALAGGFAPLVGEGASVAWEAHLIGYAAGLLLVGPVARLLGRG